jgi:protein-L-isoaspartate(D-aspartate) O-methyltransferase
MGGELIDFATARRQMIDGQVRTSGVFDQELMAALLEVPRERFVPESKAVLAYLDRDVSVVEPGAGKPARYLLKPMVFARLVQAAEIRSRDHVLDVGCASGYSTAVLARLARSVVGLEEDSEVAEWARRNLAALGVGNATIECGPLNKGAFGEGPYDVIFLNGATEIIPEALCSQLKDGGRLVCVFGPPPASKAMLYLCEHGDLSGRPVFDASAPLLPGFVKPPAFVF